MKKSILFLSLLCSVSVMADRLTIVHSNSEADRTLNIATIGQWVFFDDNRLQLTDHSGVLLADEYLDDIRKITFSDDGSTPTAIDNAQSGTISVYPNPTQDLLCVQGVEGDTTLRIYSATGQLLTTAQGTQISVGDLPAGTYLLQVGVQVIRFNKQ